MTVECQQCRYVGGISELMSGIGYMITRLAPLAAWMGFAVPMMQHLVRETPPGARWFGVVLSGGVVLLAVRVSFPGRITRLWFFARGCPKCGGRKWSRPNFAGFGL